MFYRDRLHVRLGAVALVRRKAVERVLLIYIYIYIYIYILYICINIR